MRHHCTTLLFSLILAGTSYAATIHVPGDYPTVQGAIDAANNGDEILVAPGTYTGTGDAVINLNGKAITLQATGLPQDTILDGEGLRTVVRCNSAEGPDTLINGFTLTGGYAAAFTTDSAGIMCWGSSPTITGCIISGNTSEGTGGAVLFYNGSDALISDCLIKSNAATNGAGITCYHSSDPTITNCTITDNVSDAKGGGIYCYNSDPLISGCRIIHNTASVGGGITGDFDNPTITSCLIQSNVATQTGGGIACAGSFYLLSDSTICANTPDQIDGPWVDNGGNLVLQNCPVGACCDGDVCEQLTELECAETHPGGTWLGWGSSCDDCLEPDSGACCLAEEFLRGGCLITTPSTCFQIGGEWMGGGSDCTACIPPAQPGACCTPTGCAMMWEDMCAAVDGQWLGDGVDCAQCPQSSACCLCNGCMTLWQQDCVAAGGDWLTEFDDANADGVVDCEDCPQAPPVGTCCLASGCMMNASEDDCVSNMGEWLGPNGNCDDCPQPCPGDLNGDWIVDINDLLILLGHYGPCP